MNRTAKKYTLLRIGAEAEKAGMSRQMLQYYVMLGLIKPESGTIEVGGVDKRELAKGRQEIEQEIRRLAPLVEGGGFIPTVDHAVPPDVSYENWLVYLELKRELLGI